MPSKRRFGRVRKLPSGRYQARYPGPDGVDRPAPHTFRTKTDADRWLSGKEEALRRAGWIDPAAGLMPLATYFDGWLAGRVLRPRTVELYQSLFRLYLADTLGKVPLSKLSSSVVRSWRADLLAGGAPALQVAKTYRLLRAVMNTAVDEDEIITRNPCRIRGAGQERSPERPTLEIDEVFRIADAIQPRYRMMVLLAAFVQLRYSELLALRRHDITLEEPAFLRVRISKSHAGIREVAIPAALIPDLSCHLTVYAEKGSEGRVFLGPRGATPTRTNFNRVWKKALTKSEVATPSGGSIHFHDLRHTGATLVAESGATLKELMHRVGHASPRAAMIYQHASKRREVALAGALSDMIDTARSGT